MPDVIQKSCICALAAVLGLTLCVEFAGVGRAADLEENFTKLPRLAQRSGNACAQSCMAQCRSAQSACLASGENAGSCRTQFQICVRRCVVQCGGR
ncbi:MAG: hypothetical protein ACFCUR_06200 [Rhodomicrobiaceae bacterium]